ncbi:hypothetical protein B5M42_006370 [Paenibacillus athensensis]|uniref:Uncharacterized protein n=1 Tax=Paenibacillus athensensis TaxID=1967502 RepID=A0A4Y8Q3W7_9BACL|nr:hypothetical protein [Paenibacillus athensensis]MCD1258465.1 hypothetical protein [Paenibacillus athensensis]
MWETFLGRIPTKLVMSCALLSGLIPLVVGWLVRKLHEAGTPPWKRAEQMAAPDQGQKQSEDPTA